MKPTLTGEQVLSNNNSNNDDDSTTVEDESAKCPIFSRIIMLSKKGKTAAQKPTTTRIKSRNFLSNISYVGIRKEGFYNKNFVFDI